MPGRAVSGRSVADSLFRPHPEQRARASREPKKTPTTSRFVDAVVVVGVVVAKRNAGTAGNFSNSRRASSL